MVTIWGQDIFPKSSFSVLNHHCFVIKGAWAVQKKKSYTQHVRHRAVQHPRLQGWTLPSGKEALCMAGWRSIILFLPLHKSLRKKILPQDSNGLSPSVKKKKKECFSNVRFYFTIAEHNPKLGSEFPVQSIEKPYHRGKP